MDQSTGSTEPDLGIGSTAPDFAAETTEGPIQFHEWLGESWAVLFSHPRNFTPICTTELGYLAGIEPEFARRGVKIIGLSVDPVENHAQWSQDIEETQGHAVNYPLIGDRDFAVAKAYGMLPAEVEGDPTERTPADNATVRNVFVIGPDKTIKLILVYPMTTGRNFDEVLRVIDSLQLTAKHKVATPAQWQPGGDVIIVGSVSNEEAAEKYPDGWETPRPYIRIVKQPGYDQPADAGAADATPEAAEPAPEADEPTPAADDPTPDAEEPAPDADAPTPDAEEPTPADEAPAPETGDADVTAAAADEPVAEASDEPAAEASDEPAAESADDPAAESADEAVAAGSDEPAPPEHEAAADTDEPAAEATDETPAEATDETPAMATDEPTTEATDEPVAEADEPTPAADEPTPPTDAVAESDEPTPDTASQPTAETDEPTADAVAEPAAAADEPPVATPEPGSAHGDACHGHDHGATAHAHSGHGHAHDHPTHDHATHAHSTDSASSGAASVIAIIDRTTRQVIAAAKPVVKRIAEYIETARTK